MADVIQMDQNTYRFEDGFVRFFLLIGEKKAVLIDSGVNSKNAAFLAAGLTDKPIILLNTHGDGDHTSGTGSFKEIYIHPGDYEACNLKNAFPDTTLVPVLDGDEIELGGRLLRIIHIPGHTQGSIAILDVTNRALYAGDSVQKGHIYMFGAKRCPEQYEASLDKLIALKDAYDCIYASHDAYMVPVDYAIEVKKAWKLVQNGEAPYEMMNLFGNQVKSYTLPACGFYME